MAREKTRPLEADVSWSQGRAWVGWHYLLLILIQAVPKKLFRFQTHPAPPHFTLVNAEITKTLATLQSGSTTGGSGRG